MVFIESTAETEEMRELSAHLGMRRSQTTTMADLAYLLFLMGDYSRTIFFCQKLLNEVHGNWSLAARCYGIMGQAYKNHPELALQSFENALKLQLENNPTDYNCLASMYNNMGWVHRRLESGTQLVVNFYEKALQMCKSVSDENEIDWSLMATILNNLVTAQPHGEIDLALEREQLVLDIRLKYLPLSYPLVATTHTTLAEIYLSRGEFDEALVHSDEAIRIKLKYLPDNHPSIATTYSSISLLCLYKGDNEAHQGQKETSEKSYNTSLELIYQAFDVLLSGGSSSSKHYELISFLYNNCGVVYMRLSRLDEALDCFNTAMNTSMKYLPHNHDLYGASLKNKGKIFTLQGDLNKGMEYYKLAVEFYNRIGLANSSRMAQIYFNIGEWYKFSPKKDLAVEYYERAVQIRAEHHKSSHPFPLQYAKALNRVKNMMITTMSLEDAF